MFLILYLLLALPANLEAAGPEQVVSGSNAFAYDLTNTLHQDTSSNFWISPFSVTSCFALIYPGSAEETLSQITNVMHYPSSATGTETTGHFIELHSSIESKYDGSKASKWANPASIVHIANKIYSAKSLALNPSYVDALSTKDGASFIESDFDFKTSNARRVINEWVSTATDGLIDSVLSDDMDISEWRLAALNAIYLKGLFLKQFRERKTSQNKFYADSSRQSAVGECHLMHQIDDFHYFADDHYQFLKFPFADGDLFTLFVLPRDHQSENGRNGLITNREVIDEAISNLKSTKVAVALPKLKVEASFMLKDPLKKMGMINVFDRDSADLSGIAKEKLFVDAVIHKTMLEMDEKGLKAAAVTIMGMSTTSMPMRIPKPVLFKADHPFQMFIVDGHHQNAILFMGQINNPEIPKGSVVNDKAATVEEKDAIWNKYDAIHATFEEVGHGEL